MTKRSILTTMILALSILSGAQESQQQTVKTYVIKYRTKEAAKARASIPKSQRIFKIKRQDGDTGKSVRDITEKMRAEAQLKLFATTDDLTGLWNRRYFMEQSEYAFNQAKMCHSDLALIQLDIDLFKNINDTYGHAAGDDGLRFVGKALRELLRETDLVGRIGGEEFAILIVDTDPLIVKSLSEKIRYYFQSNTFTTSGQALCFTVSLGIAFYNADVKDIDQLLALADGACYKAKSSGRNQTYCDLPMKEML